MVGIEVSTATTNVSAVTNMTMTYTNSAGTGSRTGTIGELPATAVAGTFVQFQLDSGDVGVRSIQSLTLGTSLVTGNGSTWSRTDDCPLPQYQPRQHRAALDAVTSGAPQLYNNTVPWLIWQPTATTAVTIQGSMVVTQG
ncbi:MAG: hypothetical protein U1F43_26225 [Myxococcota bacterium]